MGLKTAGVGHFTIPTAPAAGTSCTSGAANAFTTTYVQLIASTSAALYITGVHLESAAALAATYIVLQLATGGAGSETIIGQYLVPLSTGSTVALGYRQVYPPIPVANAARISCKTADSVGAKATLVTLECIAQSNVVDDGVTVGTVNLVNTLTTYTGNTPQTGDAFARLGAPAGASVSVDIAAVKTDTAAIKIQTDKLTFTVAGYLDVNAYKWVGGTIPAVTVTGVPLVDLKYVLGTISPAAAGSVRADAVTGAVGSVTGAVGSGHRKRGRQRRRLGRIGDRARDGKRGSIGRADRDGGGRRDVSDLRGESDQHHGRHDHDGDEPDERADCWRSHGDDEDERDDRSDRSNTNGGCGDGERWKRRGTDGGESGCDDQQSRICGESGDALDHARHPRRHFSISRRRCGESGHSRGEDGNRSTRLHGGKREHEHQGDQRHGGDRLGHGNRSLGAVSGGRLGCELG
jgi:hypothetical protein